MMRVIDWESAVVIGAVAVFLVGMAAALGGVIDRILPMTRRGAKPVRRRTTAPSRNLVVAPGNALAVGPSNLASCDELIQKMDDALESRDPAQAAQLWLSASRAARSDQRWENLIGVGAARLRVATVAGGRKEAEGKARELYLLALFRARQQGSLEGLLRIAESFASLGDYRLADQALRIAEVFASGTEDTQRVSTRRGILRRLMPDAAETRAAASAC